MALIDDINEKKQKKKEALQRANEQSTNIGAFSEVHRAIYEQTNALIELLTSDLDVEVKNPQKEVKVENLDKVEDKLDKLNTTTLENKVDLSPLTDAMKSLKKELEKIPKDKVEIPKVDKVTVSNLKDLEKNLSSIEKAVKAIKFPEMPKLDPKIEVKAPEVKIDLKTLEKRLETVTEAVKAIEFPEIIFPEDNGMELTELVKANQTLQKILSKPFPVPNFPTQGIIDAINNSADDTNRQQIDELSFNQTLGALGAYTTDWVDITATNTLDITANIESTAAVTAVIEYTDAADPNTTPPGSTDVTRTTTTTLAGTALGGIDNPGFSLPAQLAWARITVTDVTGGQDISVSTFDHDTPPAGAQLPLIASLTDDFKAPIGRNVIVGKDPDGDYANLRVNGTASADNFETSGNLPSGATPTYDPVNTISASNVIDTGWLETESYSYNNFRAIFNVEGIKVFLIDASDTSGNNSVTTDFSFPTAISPATGSINVGARLFQQYFRIIIFNDTGTDCTSWAYRSTWLTEDNGSIILSLDQPILDFFPAPITQTIIKGRDPAGNYKAATFGGALDDNSTTTPLLAGATYRGTWFSWGDNTYTALVTSIISDQTGTLYIDFSNEESPTDGDESSVDFSLAKTVAINELKRRITPVQSQWVRVRYVNGGVDQGTFELNSFVMTTTVPQVMLEMNDTITDDVLGGVTRSVIAAPNDSSQYGNLTRTNSGNLRTSVSEFEADVQIEALSMFQTNQANIPNSSAVQIAGSPISGRRSILVKNLASSSKSIYIGNSSAVNTSTGYELAAGEGITIELNDSSDQIWAISASGTQRACWLEVS